MIGRKGKKKAAVAIAHKILIIAYHVLKSKQPFYDLGTDFLEKRKKVSTEELMVRRLQKLGYSVINNNNTTTA